MAIASFKGLCIDVQEPTETMGRFWAAATGLRFEPDEDVGQVRGSDPHQRIWMNLVPEPRTSKNRVHLDVRTDAVQTLIDAGATIVDGYPSDHWQVLADPEGGELCAFEREPDRLTDYRLFEVVVDSVRPEQIAQWWAEVWGGEVGGDPEQGWAWVSGSTGMPFDDMVFVPVPEPKTVRNRVHWDVTVKAAADVDRLIELGATRLPGYPDDQWTVLADPEGNEFCVFVES